MAKYAEAKYNEDKYGNSSYLTATTDAFKTAQASLVRALKSELYIISHYRQFGRNIEYSQTVYAGGNNHRKVAQKFISPTSFTCSGVKFMGAGAVGNLGNLVVEIQTDTAGEPSGSEVTNATITIDPVINPTQTWVEATFNAGASLVAGTSYWIVISGDDTTNDTTYVGADDKGVNDQASFYTYEAGIYGTFKYGDGTEYGSSWADNWASTDYVLLTRLISSAEASNEQLVGDMIGWKLIRDRSLPCYKLEVDLVNDDYKYSLGQVYNDWADSNKKIKCYMGFIIDDVPVQYLVFIGTTDSSPTKGDIINLEARCSMKKLLEFNSTFSDLTSTALETVIQGVSENAGISSFDLRATSIDSPATLSLQSITAYNVAEKARQVTLDRMQFYNTETLSTTARAKASISESTVPSYVLDKDDFILDATIGKNNDSTINRATITNDEDGETTTDDLPLDVGDYQSIGTESGNLLSTEQTKDITITFSENPVMYIQINDAESDCEITAIDLDCGTSAGVGSATVTLRNRKYPDDAGAYDLTANGCPISNATATTHIGESINVRSWDSNGKFPQRIDNKLISSKTIAENMADYVINETSVPLEIVEVNARGIVDLYPDDVIRLVESQKTKLNHLAIVHSVELMYDKDPASFLMLITGEKTNYYGS